MLDISDIKVALPDIRLVPAEIRLAYGLTILNLFFNLHNKLKQGSQEKIHGMAAG